VPPFFSLSARWKPQPFAFVSVMATGLLQGNHHLRRVFGNALLYSSPFHYCNFSTISSLKSNALEELKKSSQEQNPSGPSEAKRKSWHSPSVPPEAQNNHQNQRDFAWPEIPKPVHHSNKFASLKAKLEFEIAALEKAIASRLSRTDEKSPTQQDSEKARAEHIASESTISAKPENPNFEDSFATAFFDRGASRSEIRRTPKFKDGVYKPASDSSGFWQLGGSANLGTEGLSWRQEYLYSQTVKTRTRLEKKALRKLISAMEKVSKAVALVDKLARGRASHRRIHC
jgi:hypothetical protein